MVNLLEYLHTNGITHRDLKVFSFYIKFIATKSVTLKRRSLETRRFRHVIDQLVQNTLAIIQRRDRETKG